MTDIYDMIADVEAATPPNPGEISAGPIPSLSDFISPSVPCAAPSINLIGSISSTIDTVSDINLDAMTPPVPAPVVPAEPVKKRPGRPPKKRPGQPTVQKYGIVPMPANPRDVIEIIHDKPQLFKDIWSVIKGYHSQEIIIHFDHTYIAFYALDRTREFHIHMRIDAKFLVLYHCKFPVKISVKYTDLASIMETISPNHYRITLLAREDDYQRRFYVLLNNTDNGQIKAEVNVTCNQTAIPAIPANDTFVIWFRQNRKQFKKLIGDWTKNKTQMFSIEKNDNNPLQFQQIGGDNKRENLVFTYPDEVIGLQSRLSHGNIFVATVKIDAVKAFASANAGDDIYFYVNHREIVFKSFLDRQKCGSDICQIDVVAKIRSSAPGQLQLLPDIVN